MSAISTFANYRDAQRIRRYLTATGPTSTGAASFTRMGGSTAAAASTPGTAYSSDTTASFTFQDTSAVHKYISEFIWHFIGNSTATSVYLIDKLVGVNFSLSSTGSKTISSTALTRYTNGKDVQAWVEVTTAPATTIPVVSLESYTDQDGNPGAAGGSVTFLSATSAAGNWYGPFGLASGDYGVTAVASVNVTTAGSAGAANLVLAKTMLVYGSTDSIVRAYERLFWVPGQRVYDGATLTLLHRATNASEQATAELAVVLAE